jgi:hypothetical protein
VLKKYAGKNRENMILFRERQKQIMDSLFYDLKPFLTTTQQQRFINLQRRRLRFLNNGPRPHHRGPVPRGRP